MPTNSDIVQARGGRVALIAIVLLGGGVIAAAMAVPGDVADVRPTPAPIEFNRHIRPILSDNCYQCHGPDAAARQADLRLDERDAAIAPRRDGAAIVPGDARGSRLIHRVTAEDDEDRMPPAETGKQLTPTQVRRLEQWIDDGAPWEAHWSFIPPDRPTPPPIRDPSRVRNPIDAFILARLDDEGLAPSPPADRATLLRRVTLDLTGLPPTPEEIDAFIADESPDAYGRVIDRLLASPRYGEHMARFWLDAARYGDTHGLHLDNRRSMWRWRDWVIDAFNRNLPYDRFSIDQLAGDLLPEPTLEQKIATGFNRNNVTTSEGGAIDEEYLVKYAADRLETTATVWLGLTVGCAQCHDHKFDPISQREYYQLFAFFNNITEQAMDGNRPDPPPVMRAPTDAQAAHLADLDARLATLEARLDAPIVLIDAAQAQWEQRWRDGTTSRWCTLTPRSAVSTGGADLRLLDDGSVLAAGANPDADTYELVLETTATDLRLLRLEALTHDSLPEAGPGRAPNGNFVLSEIEAEVVSRADLTVRRPLRFVAAASDHEQMDGPYLVEQAVDGVVDEINGWAPEGHRFHEDRVAVLLADEPFGFAGGMELHVRLRFETQFAAHAIGRLRLSAGRDAELAEVLSPSTLGPWWSIGPFPANDGSEAFRLPFGPEQEPADVRLDQAHRDGALAWRERPEFTDGAIHDLAGESCATYLYRTISAPTARTLEISLGSDDGLKAWLNGRDVLERDVARVAAPDQDRVTLDLQPGTNHLLLKVTNRAGGYAFYFRPAREGADSEFLRMAQILAVPPADRSEAQRIALRRYYRRHQSPALKETYERIRVLEEERRAFETELPVTLVMQERDERRPTFVLRRGEYDQPTDPVEPGVPAVLPPLADDAPRDRLAFARWIVSPEHPLTARVTVNRLWQQLFGRGIVRTVEDFGSQGEWPSHPALLDWLACEFVDSGWDVRHMLRLMVSSATYRQSSRVSPALLARDPENRLLARGPRFRLDAEVIRDQALAASGLLVEQVGGPGVRPYQPSGLWKAVAYPDSDTRQFMQDTGDALYRRSLYTFWKRTSPPPSLATFDAPTRETCTVRRPRTNTPLQALVLMNDPQFVEAARHLAQRCLAESGTAGAGAIGLAFRLVNARPPEPHELEVLLDLYQDRRAWYEADPAAAAALLAVGESPTDERLDPVELAALGNVCSVILGLDEAVTKE